MRSFGILIHESEELVPADKSYLAGMEGLGGDLIGLSRKRGHQAENLARPGNPEDERLTLAGIDGELYLTFTEDKHAAGILVLHEEDGTRRIGGRGLGGIQIFQSFGGHVAEKTGLLDSAGLAAIAHFKTVWASHITLPPRVRVRFRA